MKKYFLILGMALLTGSFIYAGVDNPNKTTETSVQSSGDKVKLYYKSTEINPVKVAIFNERNEKILIETLKTKKASFIRPYDFSKMPEGTYTLVLEDANGKRTETFTIDREQPELLTAIIDLKKSDERKCVITLSGKNSPMAYISVKNLRNQVVFSKELTVKSEETVLLNLNELNGAATVEVYGGGTFRSKVIE